MLGHYRSDTFCSKTLSPLMARFISKNDLALHLLDETAPYKKMNSFSSVMVCLFEY